MGVGEGDIRVVVNNAKIDTEGDHSANGVDAWRDGAGGGYGKVYIDISDSEITTNGLNGFTIEGKITAPSVLAMKTTTELYQESDTGSHGIWADKGTTGTGDILVETTGGEITTQGKESYGILTYQTDKVDGSGDIDVRTTSTDITTHGEGAVGIYARQHGSGDGAMRRRLSMGRWQGHHRTG